MLLGDGVYEQYMMSQETRQESSSGFSLNKAFWAWYVKNIDVEERMLFVDKVTDLFRYYKIKQIYYYFGELSMTLRTFKPSVKFLDIEFSENNTSSFFDSVSEYNTDDFDEDNKYSKFFKTPVFKFGCYGNRRCKHFSSYSAARSIIISAPLKDGKCILSKGHFCNFPLTKFTVVHSPNS